MKRFLTLEHHFCKGLLRRHISSCTEAPDASIYPLTEVCATIGKREK